MNRTEMINKLNEIKGQDFMELQVALIIEFLQEYLDNNEERIEYMNDPLSIDFLKDDIVKYEIEGLLGSLEKDVKSLNIAKNIAMDILNEAREIVEKG